MFKLLIKLLNNSISTPASKEHPFLKKRIKNRVRNMVRINYENCNFCGVCSRKCIAKAIILNKDSNIITIDQLSCILCGLCEEDCPRNCIKVISS